jgi:Tfp pilus assembly protein PilZ
MPGSERSIAVRGVVVWLNPRQQHPVHSLPPGFGLKFADLTSDDRERIERVVEEYVGGLPQG